MTKRLLTSRFQEPTIRFMNTNETGDWITITMACRIFPSRHPGKRLNKSTVWRWILDGRIEHTRNELGWVFVRESQIRSLVTPASVRKEEQKEHDKARRQWEAHKAAIFARHRILG